MPLGIVRADDPVTVNAEAPTSTKKTIYRLLAPIPGLTCIDDTGSDTRCAKGGIGEYLNIIFKIGIGLCGVLAVVMLVINFIGYMSSESFTEKAHFKQKFWGPIGGLLLALAAYAILTTINPSLTGKDGLTIDQVGIVIESEVVEYTPQQASSIIQSYRNNTGSFSTPTPGPTSIQDNSPGLLKNIAVNQVAPIIERNGLGTVKAIIMHGTAGGGGNASVQATFIEKRGRSGAHFTIDKDGTIWQLARVTKYTNHFIADGRVPGISNSNTIGIELVQRYICDDGTYAKCRKGHWENISGQQVSAVKKLLEALVSEFKLDPKGANIYGHGEVGKDRTPDEGLEAIKKSGFCPSPCRIK